MVLASLTKCKRNYFKFVLPSLFLSKITTKLKRMKQHILTILIFLISFGESQIVYKVPIHDTIDLGLPPFIERSIKMAEDYLLGKPGIASRNCLIKWLDNWAKAGALLSTDSNHTGMSVRKWALASTASAYISIKAPSNAGNISISEQQNIENWFAKLADQVVIDWSNRPKDKRNNHDYWAAWSVMISSIILKRQDLFDWANEGLKQGLAQIDNDGFLPNELKRDFGRAGEDFKRTFAFIKAKD